MTTIASSDIRSKQVKTANIDDGAVTTAKIANGNITSDKLDTNISITGTLGVTSGVSLTSYLDFSYIDNGYVGRIATVPNSGTGTVSFASQHSTNVSFANTQGNTEQRLVIGDSDATSDSMIMLLEVCADTSIATPVWVRRLSVSGKGDLFVAGTVNSATISTDTILSSTQKTSLTTTTADCTIHKHDHGAMSGLNDDDHTHYYNQTRGDARYATITSLSGYAAATHASAHLPGGSDALTTAAANQITVTTAAVGTATSFARSDHVHSVSTGTPSDILVQTAAEGTATSLARSDHKHNVSTAAAGSISPDDAAAVGTASSLSRSDHKHAITTAVAGASAVGDSAAEGTATSFARSDHKHSREAFTTPSAIGSANAAGTATTIVRSDHVHAHGSALLCTHNHDSSYVPFTGAPIMPGWLTITGHGTVSGGAGDTDVSLNIQNVSGASSSIIFSSGINKADDKGVIRYYDSADVNEVATTGESGLMLIATENDAASDRVRIRGGWVEIAAKIASGTSPKIVSFMNNVTEKANIDLNGKITWLSGNSDNANAAYTHKSSTGADHSYIDQSVTTTSSPTFASVLHNGDVKVGPSDGRGLRFWDNDIYKIYMSSSGNATWGGRLDSTSDYNMYLRMASGTNRGFVFLNNTTPVAQVDSTGKIYSQGGYNASNKFEMMYNPTTNSLDFNFVG